MNGTVLKYDVKRGFGFVMGDNGQQYFVHKSYLPFWIIYLTKGARIKFKSERSNKKNKGPVATEIQVLKELKK